MIRKLLVANRGEIAVRVIRAARELGIRTVAVASEADLDAPHAHLADELVCIGPPEAARSYLDADAIVEAARATGADAVHPGYGFLSERAAFARRCRDEGLVFVGPPPEAMERLGDKIAAKSLALHCGVPVTPGFFDREASPERMLEEARHVGFPLMLKAAAGGGGRGMRIVSREEDFLSELVIASAEAAAAFGDGTMMFEKLVLRPRHVEVQILADEHGEVAALFERECSLQRRHQKLVEESPSPLLVGERAARWPDLWPRMREAAMAVVREAGYTNAGTVEFMVDEAAGEFYFLEVNARLQVEHPVTEAVTGLDLVKWQLRIASGERLDLDRRLMEGQRSAISGHAIEARIVAEDPARGFLPSAGPIHAWAQPSGPGIRVDAGYGPGCEVPRFYDGLLAKVIAHAESRDEAIDRLALALEDFHVVGPVTTIGFLLDVIRHPGFRAGEIDTGFLEREFGHWRPSDDVPPELGVLFEHATAPRGAVANRAEGPRSTAWALVDSWRISRD